MVEDILSMNTGSHLLGAFNIDFDSFVDNVVFCALIDRVGKYQLAMQKISAYQPMAESMPQMLREEAFHLAAGVVPMRRWVMQAARGEGCISMDMLQRAINKWLPRGLEMFGDERGGGTNVRFGLKPMKNAEAQQPVLRRRSASWSATSTCATCAPASRTSTTARPRPPSTHPGRARRSRGSGREELLRMPHAEFFRRRGVPAFRWSAPTARPSTTCRPTSGTWSGPCPTPTAPAATTRTTWRR